MKRSQYFILILAVLSITVFAGAFTPTILPPDLPLAVENGGTGSGLKLGDVVTTAPLTGGVNDIFPGADADILTLGVSTATTDAEGVSELATDAETVTGTAADRVTTPAGITAKLAEPGAIGGTTPATGAFTTIDTGQGANELYDMDQNVLTSSTPSFAGMSNTGAQTVKKTNVADAAYGTSALTTDYIVAWTSLSVARAAVISTEDEDSGTITQPRVMIFKDESGSAETYNITISLESGGTINGASTYVLNTNYESVNIYLNGVNGFAY